MNTTCPLGFAVRADLKEDFDGFLPGGAVVLGIEESHIEFNVLAVILGERWAFRGLIDIIEFRHRERCCALYLG
ncbi:hypothetical protein ASD54_14430 [Rhizobium sp. Root149]|nr:hypothetical protein ASD54_14430 [Rhizobium sp. Root149]